MSKLRKIALIGIGVAVLATIIALIFGFPPAAAGVHALPFCMMLITDISREKNNTDDLK